MQPLTDKEKCVLDLRFGLTDGQPRKLAEIARILGLSRQNVWEVELKAMWKVNLRSENLQVDPQSVKLIPSALISLRASLTDFERQVLKQEWGISDPNDVSCSSSDEQIKQVQTKALSMI